MAVFKRYKGRRISRGDEGWDDKAGWWIEFRIGNHHVFQRATADTKTEAEREERKLQVELQIDVENQPRQNRGKTKTKTRTGVHFTEFVDEYYLPWARVKKKSVAVDISRLNLLKEAFSDMRLRKIKSTHVERLKSSLLGKETCRKTLRTGATVNRYISLLSKILEMAYKQGFVSSNPCKRVEKEKEDGDRERYLRDEEKPRLLAALTGDLEFLRPAVILALGTGMRRMEMMRLRVQHINFGSLPVFSRVNTRDVEIPPNHFLVEKSKNGRSRIIPMNDSVRSTLYSLIEDASDDECVFSFARNGVSLSTLRSGFEKACKAAGIAHGTKSVGGIVWHDLRHTFATRLREQGIHQLEIMDLMGHSSLSMVTRYAHGTPAAMQRAVDSLTQPSGGEILDLTDQIGVC